MTENRDAPNGEFNNDGVNDKLLQDILCFIMTRYLKKMPYSMESMVSLPTGTDAISNLTQR